MESVVRLSDQGISELLCHYRSTRDSALRDRIIDQFTNLVESIARRYAGPEPAEDLVQEGYIGLLSAVEGFDPTKGVKFSTYATHFIIGQIKHHVRDRGKIIKEPAWLQELNQKVLRASDRLLQQLGRAPTHSEVAAALGMTEEAVADLASTREVFKVASLDGTDQEDESAPAFDTERVRPAVGSEPLPVEDKLVLEAALCKLKNLEQTVIREFYFRGSSQTEIARSLEISCNYVSHILRNSTRKLKRIIATDDLREAHLEMAAVRRRDDPAGVMDRSVMDAATRLYSRRYFDARLEEELLRASRVQDEVALLHVRLAGMAEMAGAHGSARSDEAMRSAADIVRRSVRRLDIVTRFDRDAFCLILPHTGPQVQVVVDRLADVLGQWLSEVGLDRGRAPVTLMVGCAWSPRDATRAADLVAASQAAYRVVSRAAQSASPEQAA